MAASALTVWLLACSACEAAMFEQADLSCPSIEVPQQRIHFAYASNPSVTVQDLGESQAQGGSHSVSLQRKDMKFLYQAHPPPQCWPRE